MCNQLLTPEEFFIYVPLLHEKEFLNNSLGSNEKNALNHSAHEDWVKILLAEPVIVYAHVCGEAEKQPLFL